MSSKTIHYCDVCGATREPDKLQRFCYGDKFLDACSVCRTHIIDRVVKEKLINLRPFCKECKGTGKVEKVDTRVGSSYDHVERSMVNCGACKL
jgi:hypothetical protein